MTQSFLLRFLRRTIQRVLPIEKRFVCNRKGSICKDLTIEINSILPAFLDVVY
jgi:hypothetical protein